MKKFLAIISQIILMSSVSLTLTACQNPLAGGSNGESKPSDPIVRDISYYQELIKVTKKYINDCKQMLEEIKDNKDGYDDEKDYQSALDEVTAERYFYQALVNEYQYQILLLEKDNEGFSLEQILQGITIFTAKVSNSEQEFKLKAKYPDYYSKEELAAIKDKIKQAQVTLEMFIRLKEEKGNETTSFLAWHNSSRC